MDVIQDMPEAESLSGCESGFDDSRDYSRGCVRKEKKKRKEERERKGRE
jgi:hypothetical protein